MRMRETTLDRDRHAIRSSPSQSRSLQHWVGFAVLSVLYLISRVGFFAFVAPYEVAGEPAGSIGVLGPTRMNYPQALAAVAVVSQRLGRRLTEG